MEEKVSLVDIARLMLHKWWIILLSMVIGGVLLFLYSDVVLSPIYISEGSLYVNSSSERADEDVNLTNITTSQMFIPTCIEVLTSNSSMQRIADYSGLGLTGSEVRSMISMASKNDTEILSIQAGSTDPEVAQIVVDAVLANAQDELMRVVKGGSAEVVDAASLPTAPSSPNKRVYTAVGVLLGLFVSMLLIYLVDLFDTRVRREEDLTNIYEMPVLGSIPELAVPKEKGVQQK